MTTGTIVNCGQSVFNIGRYKMVMVEAPHWLRIFFMYSFSVITLGIIVLMAVAFLQSIKDL